MKLPRVGFNPSKSAAIPNQDTSKPQTSNTGGPALTAMIISAALSLSSLLLKGPLTSHSISPDALSLFFLFFGFGISALMTVNRIFGANLKHFDSMASTSADIGKEVRKQLRGFVEALDSKVDCRFIGMGKDTMSTVISRLKEAQQVRNTFVLFEISDQELPGACYRPQQIKDLQAGLKTFLIEGAKTNTLATWTDIVSHEVVISKRLQWLKFLDEIEEDIRAKEPESMPQTQIA